MGEGGVGDRLGRPHPLDFHRVLHGAQAGHEVGGFHDARGDALVCEGGLEGAELAKGQVVFDAHDARCARRLQTACRPLCVGDAIVLDVDGSARSRRAAGERIARIGVQGRRIGPHEHGMRLLVVEHVVEGRHPGDARRTAHVEGVDSLLAHGRARPLEAARAIVAVVHTLLLAETPVLTTGARTRTIPNRLRAIAGPGPRRARARAGRFRPRGRGSTPLRRAGAGRRARRSRARAAP